MAKDTDYIFLSAMLRAREAGMLSEAPVSRMLGARSFDEAAKLAADCGYPGLSGLDFGALAQALGAHRVRVFDELSANPAARGLVDIFRAKYDYHNIKVLVKSMSANLGSDALLSDSGRIPAAKLTEAFISKQRSELPPRMAAAISQGVGTLSRTGDPQLSDTAVDLLYFDELLAMAHACGDAFITGYVRLMIDSANLRIFVRARRTARSPDFIKGALIPGGGVSPDAIAKLPPDGDGLRGVFGGKYLSPAADAAASVLHAGGQTEFERLCDNAVLAYLSESKQISFGPAPVFCYIAELEWEIMTIRMILTGKLSGLPADTIRERLRECHV